jgi:sulfite dehydrogenase
MPWHPQGALPLPAGALRAGLPGGQLPQKTKPKSKVLVLDANEEITSKKGLFTKAFEKYKGILEYRPNSELREVDAASRTAILEFDKVKADVLNVVPPQRAGDIAAKSGIKLINNRWVDIDWLSFESVNTPGVHVIGDAIFPAPTMPKSGHMANQHAKVAAAAILNLLAGEAPNPAGGDEHLLQLRGFKERDPRGLGASVRRGEEDGDAGAGAGGVSAAANELEASTRWPGPATSGPTCWCEPHP